MAIWSQGPDSSNLLNLWAARSRTRLHFGLQSCTQSTATGAIVRSQDIFFERFLSRARFVRASFLSRSSFDTVRTMRSALLMRPASVLPGTFGAGSGFISFPIVMLAVLV